MKLKTDICSLDTILYFAIYVYTGSRSRLVVVPWCRRISRVNRWSIAVEKKIYYLSIRPWDDNRITYAPFISLRDTVGAKDPRKKKFRQRESELFPRPIGLSVIVAWVFANSGAASTIIKQACSGRFSLNAILRIDFFFASRQILHTIYYN